MNIAMEQTEEYVNGQLKAKYGDTFIRGNNGEKLCQIEDPTPTHVAPWLNPHHTYMWSSSTHASFVHQHAEEVMTTNVQRVAAALGARHTVNPRGGILASASAAKMFCYPCPCRLSGPVRPVATAISLE